MNAERWTGWAVALLLLAFDASAQEHPLAPGRGDDVRPQQGMGQGPHRQQRGRGDGAGPQGMRPAQFDTDAAAAPQHGRMSREERRQLRRDVDEAGRDLYPERRRASNREQASPPQEAASSR